MAVEKFPAEAGAITNLVTSHPEGLSIRGIAKTLGMNRNSVAKYLDMLQMQGRVTVRRYGSAKVYTMANRMPVNAVLKLSTSNVMVFGPGMTVTGINEPFRELLRASDTSLLGKPVSQLPVVLESHPDIYRPVRDALKGTEIKFSDVLVLPDRSLAGMFTFSPVFLENGNPGVALIADIAAGTSNHTSTDTIDDRSLIELDELEYICRFRVNGTLTYTNRAYAELLQKFPADLIGHEWRPMVPDDEFKKIRTCLSGLSPARPVSSLEFRAITPKGESRWQRWKFRGLFGPDGLTSAYQGTGIDITEIKKLEAEINRHTAEREKLIDEHKAEIQDLNLQLYTEIASREKADFQLEFTRFAMNNASYMIIWITRDARFVYMNRRARRVLGFAYHELVTKSFLDLLAGDLPLPWDEMWEATRQDHQRTFETAIKTRDGREIPVEIVLNYLEFKEIQYCCCFATDITERRNTETTFHEVARYARSLIEVSLDPLIMISPEGRITDVNAATEQVTGFSRDILIGTDFSGYFTDPVHARKGYEKVLRDGSVLDYPLEIKNRDGTIRQVLYHATVYRDSAGAVKGIFASARDVTGRRNTENALQEAEQRMADIISFLPNATFAIDREGKVIVWNRAIEEMTGVRSEDILGHGDYAYALPFYGMRRPLLIDLILRPDPELLKTYSDVRMEGEVLTAETPKVRFGGKDHYLWAKAALLRNTSGEIVGAIESIRDITMDRETETVRRGN